MSAVEIGDVSELLLLPVGTIGASSWFAIDQRRIDAFADATMDWSPVHVNPEWAQTQGPFGTTIAHGYLTLSLVIPLWQEVLNVRNSTFALNYGLNRVRFVSPVEVGSRLRLNASLVSAKAVDPAAFKDAVQVVVDFTVSKESSDKPALVAEMIYRFYQ